METTHLPFYVFILAALAYFAETQPAKKLCIRYCGSERYSPVCGSDGRTYNNLCLLKNVMCNTRSVQRKHNGRCRNTRPCKHTCGYEYSPVCGNDQKSYDNRCLLRSAAKCSGKQNLVVAYVGLCKEDTNIDPNCPKRCPNTYAPVCGSNGQTYANNCHFKHAKYCLKEDISYASNGPCSNKPTVNPNCRKRCSNTYAPVCGSNGQTYANDCSFKYAKYCLKEDISSRSWGACSPSYSRIPAISSATRMMRTPRSLSTFCVGKRSRNYPDPNRCDGFVTCDRRRAFRMDCPANLWYNFKKDQCDWHRNVACKVKGGRRPAGRPSCPREQGYCVKFNGRDQNSGVIKLNNLDVYKSAQKQVECLRLCLARPDATGCEVIWGRRRNRGCYVHTKEVAKGNKHSQHACWVFAKCIGVRPKIQKSCQSEAGYCVKYSGWDQNSGVIKLNNLDGNTPQRQHQCLNLCLAHKGATGCEEIWGRNNRGCYVHTKEVAKGNGVAKHMCWVFSKCKKTSQCPTRCPNTYAPVCGSNGQTYDNECQFNHAKYCYRGRPLRGLTFIKGPCECPSRCPNTYSPVCASNRRTYSNKCQFNMVKYCQKQMSITIEHAGPCVKAKPSFCKTGCPFNRDPVCGSDGETYENECLLRKKRDCKGVTLSVKSKGRCKAKPCPRLCPTVYDPICSTNRTTYINRCKLQSAIECDRKRIQLDHYGACSAGIKESCPRVCEYSFEPVCATNRQTYSNECLLRKAIECDQEKIKLKHLGKCGTNPSFCQIVCSYLWDPVCASNRKIFANDCLLKQAITCKKQRIRKTNMKVCKRTCRRKGCPLNVDPVCGSDGRSYDNKCLLESEAGCKGLPITILYNGKCYSRRRHIKCPTKCPRIHSPVCGTNRKTYANMCRLNWEKYCLSKSVEKWYNGRCRRTSARCPRRCPNLLKPVCASNQRTYDNECQLRVAIYCEGKRIRKKHTGKCRGCTRRCARNLFKPVCASDQRTYNNQCLMEEAICQGKRIRKMYEGMCTGRTSAKCPKACPNLLKPVCASDGKTYSNECEMKVAIYCRGKRMRKRYEGRCRAYAKANLFATSNCPKACGYTYQPVCASNGKTYNNKCLLDDAINCQNLIVRKLHDGQCTDRDRICTQPSSSTRCGEYSKKWYSNAKKEKCEPFVHGGCTDSKNVFNSKKECMGFCYTDVCTLPMVRGICTGFDPRFYFNATDGQCKPFVYGGCQGNANSFFTADDCEVACDKCNLPPAAGRCRSMFRRFHYDPVSKTCKRFVYGGCDGNANNFNSMDECNRECGKDRVAEEISPEGFDDYGDDEDDNVDEDDELATWD